MELEILKPHISLLDGVRADRCGEWPGIKSSKWVSSIKVMRPVNERNLFDGKGLLIVRSDPC